MDEYVGMVVSAPASNGPYFQGWEAISNALMERLGSLSLLEHVHPYLQFVRENPETDEWKEKFAVRSDGVEDGWIVNVVMINRSGFPVVETCKDDSTRFSRRSSVELYVFYSFPDFVAWQKLLDQVMDCLVNGDRTLGECCLTYSMPMDGDSSLAAFAGVDCHSTVIKFKIEEAGVLG